MEGGTPPTNIIEPQKDLESFFEVKIDRSVSLKAVLDSIPSKNRVTFIIDRRLNIILSNNTHATIMKMNGIEKQDCVLTDGSFTAYRDPKELQFVYTSGDQVDKNPTEFTDAAENKIMEFLRAQGLEVK